MQISIHALREEGDKNTGLAVGLFTNISIHALREEGDSRRTSTRQNSRNFYPRPPRGGRQTFEDLTQTDFLFLSTPSARRATQRGRRDTHKERISIHALREEGDAWSAADTVASALFLSTPSARRATLVHQKSSHHPTHFYPRPPRGGRPNTAARCGKLPVDFYPRPPRGGRPGGHTQGRPGFYISIHALREEGDAGLRVLEGDGEQFLSTPSARRATDSGIYDVARELFLSTPSARRATQIGPGVAWCEPISIHALREEGDHATVNRPTSRKDFYPRPPRGGRRPCTTPICRRHRFLSTPSARRATAKTETKSLFSNKLYNILHEFRRALIYNGSKSYPNHAK